MSLLELLTPYRYITILGVLSHVCYFKYGEHHLRAPWYCLLAIWIFCVAVGAEVFLFSLSSKEASALAIRGLAAYVLGLFSSIVIYRLFFHSLRDFPGPKAMAISKLVHVFNSRKLDNYLQLDKLRQQYGDIIRTGPSELCIFRPEAYYAICGPQSKCTKAPMYDLMQPIVSVHSTRDPADHDRRRKIWDRAFSIKGRIADINARKCFKVQSTDFDVIQRLPSMNLGLRDTLRC